MVVAAEPQPPVPCLTGRKGTRRERGPRSAGNGGDGRRSGDERTPSGSRPHPRHRGRQPGGRGRARSRHRTATDPDVGVEGPRRPRGRWIRAPRPSRGVAVGRCRPRRHHADVGGGGTSVACRARRVPRGAQGTALQRVPPQCPQRCSSPGEPRRPGRDLERHAVLLAVVGEVPACGVPPPCARRDVADGVAASAGPGR